MARNILYKSHWRWLLFLSALVVFVFILYYSSKLINNIAQEERQRVEIWAGAITYKAQIVNETEHFFNSIRLEEGNHAALLAKAIKKVTEADLDEDLTFYQDIIRTYLSGREDANGVNLMFMGRYPLCIST